MLGPHDLALLGGVFVATVAGLAAYRPLAIRLRIVAVPNERTLHRGVIPRGAGAVVVLAFLVATVVSHALAPLPGGALVALVGGGIAVAVLGFVDDIVQLATRTRLLAHIALAIALVVALGPIESLAFGDAQLALGPLAVPLTALGVVWMINLFNFMDGIDGMCASGAALFALVIAGLLIAGGGSPYAVPLAALGVASLAFLVFNWPPASMFLGDAGSGFYGYALAAFALATTRAGEVSAWTWLILLAYFVGDTTTTLLIRVRTVPRFWGTHRSHAYQNLARVWDDHRRVTSIVLAIQIGWQVPLAIASVRWPALGAPLAVAALLPPVALALRFGPRYAR